MEIYSNRIIQTHADLLEHMKEIENICRHSKCYKAIIGYLKDTLGLKYSTTFPNIDFLEKDIDLECHHIITLWDIIEAVGMYMLYDENENNLTVFKVADKVMELHSQDYIPFVVLSVTEHQLYHSGDFTFNNTHPCLHLGKVIDFLKIYHEYITDDSMIRIRNLLPDNDIKNKDAIDSLLGVKEEE